MSRDFFEGYAERVDINSVLGDNLSDEGSSPQGMPLEVMFRGRVKNYVENRSLLVKEFELDLYKTPDGRYVIHICRLDGSSNYCDYYLVRELPLALQYRMVRAMLCESLEPDDIQFEFGKHAHELEEVSSLLARVHRFRGEI